MSDPADRVCTEHDTGPRRHDCARHTLTAVQSAIDARRPLYVTPVATTPAAESATTTGFSAQQEGILNLLAVNAVVRTNAVVLQPSLRDFLG